MAKNSGDIIMRDRMQFTLDANGDQTTLYGRIDTSAYVNTVAREGLAVKQVFFQLRDPAAAGLAPNTGNFSANGDGESSTTTGVDMSALKLYMTTRAYENASEVGIGSPDVLCIYTRNSYVAAAPTGGLPAAGGGTPFQLQEEFYGPLDLHPEGYTVVSDLLVGVAVDDWVTLAERTVEIDILVIAEPITVTTARMNEILSQAQDL